MSRKWREGRVGAHNKKVAVWRDRDSLKQFGMGKISQLEPELLGQTRMLSASAMAKPPPLSAMKRGLRKLKLFSPG